MGKDMLYKSIEQQYLTEAKNYLDRAESYLLNNKPRHALGCMVKAYRKVERAESLNLNIDLIIAAILRPNLNMLSKFIADRIMNDEPEVGKLLKINLPPALE